MLEYKSGKLECNLFKTKVFERVTNLICHLHLLLAGPPRFVFHPPSALLEAPGELRATERDLFPVDFPGRSSARDEGGRGFWVHLRHGQVTGEVFINPLGIDVAIS